MRNGAPPTAPNPRLFDDEFQNGDVTIFSKPLDTATGAFPIGTECVILRRLDNGDYEVEVMEPRPEVVRIPADALESVEP